MQIRSNTWHARLYFEYLRMIKGFTARPHSFLRKYENTSNLCHYIRVLTIYGPLVVGSHLFTLSAVAFSFFLLPIQLFGISGFLTTTLVILIICSIVIAFCWVLIKGIDAYMDWRKSKPKKIKKEKTGDSAFRVALTYIKEVKKNKLCPLISFEKENKENA